MRNSLKKPKIIIFGSILAISSIGISFLIFGITVWTNQTKFPYYVPLIIFASVYAFLAYLIGDLRIVKYKKKVQEFNPVIPENVQEEVWDRRVPFVVGLIAALAVLAVFFIIRLITGQWPFLP